MLPIFFFFLSRIYFNIFEHNRIGFTGSYRVGQQLQYAVLPAPGKNLMSHLVLNIVPAVRSIAGDDMDQILVGCAGRLFKIDSDYAVAEYDHYAAAGGGEAYALGRLHGSLGAPELRVLAALEAAQAHCAGVRGPFFVEVI